MRLPAQFKPTRLATVLLLLGALRLLRSPQRLGLLAGPIIVSLGVALLGIYPFHSRLILILLPCYFWIVAVGVDSFLQARMRTIADKD